MSTAAVVANLSESLARWARARGGESARVANVHDLGGHSGETFGFTYSDARTSQDLVIKLASRGEGQRAIDELGRQARLLALLHTAGAKVAAVADASADQGRFGTAYMIVERLAGRPLIMGPEGGESMLSQSERQLAHERAAEALAQLHGLDATSGGLADWDEARSPASEVDAWCRALDRSAQSDWGEQGHALADGLRASCPSAWTLALCHGDYQTNNVLFTFGEDGPKIGGIVDWEIAHRGAAELDLAWFLMMNDERAWHPVERRGGIDLDAVTRSYEAKAGRPVAGLAWFRALACYRFAAIAGYKIRLHRTGRKLDDAWERISSSMPCFFARAHEHLAEAA